MRKINISGFPLLLFGFLISIYSCKKLVEVDTPKTSSSGQTVYETDGTAAAVLTGLYTNLVMPSLSQGSSPVSFMSLYPGLSADEFNLYSGLINPKYVSYYKNNLSNITGPNTWTDCYSFIYICNAAIEGLTKSESLTPSIRNQLLGEAKFVRAFLYFYIVNLYGDVPLTLTTDYNTNGLLARTPKEQVYQQILSDIKDAQSLLSETYLSADITTPSTDRVRPTKWAADALLARIYLYRSAWADAETQANTLINNTSLFTLSDLAHAFLKAQSGNSEAIWQLQPVNTGWNTEDAKTFILTASGPTSSRPVYLSQFLLGSFEPDDQRRKSWIDSVIAQGNIYYYAKKYKSATFNAAVTEHKMVFRLGEQFLIRAEARARQNHLDGSDGAIADLNSIRQRAGLPGYSGPSNQDSVLNAIFQERHVEMFTEWGDRWLDLKRTGQIDSVMNIVSPIKGSTWNTNSQYYPLSIDELNADPRLTQNSGY